MARFRSMLPTSEIETYVYGISEELDEMFGPPEGPFPEDTGWTEEERIRYETLLAVKEDLHQILDREAQEVRFD